MLTFNNRKYIIQAYRVSHFFFVKRCVLNAICFYVRKLYIEAHKAFEALQYMIYLKEGVTYLPTTQLALCTQAHIQDQEKLEPILRCHTCEKVKTLY